MSNVKSLIHVQKKKRLAATLSLLESTHHAHGLRGGFNPISQGGNTKGSGVVCATQH